MKKHIKKSLSLIFALGITIGCGHEHHHHDHDDHHAHSSDSEHAHHEHVAPHGGTLVVFGDEFAHIELVLDKKTGQLTVYALDGEAEKSIRLKLKELILKIQLDEKTGFDLTVNAVENQLTGETVGDTSEFRGQSDRLKGKDNFNAILQEISIRGKAFKNVEFRFPEGNEEDHHES